MWNGANNDQLWLSHGLNEQYVEQYSNWFQLDLILLANLSYELGQIKTRYDFLELDEWFWAMFEPTTALPNVILNPIFI